MLKQIFTVLKNKYFYLLASAVFVVPYSYEHMPIRIDITQQASLDNKLWLTYSDLSKDTEYVLFTPPLTKYTKDRDVEYLKKIGCSQGQSLEVIDNIYFCDGKPLGKALEKDMNGNKMEKFIFNGIVPNGELFVVGTHPYSFDSKYFGFIKENDILRKARPFDIKEFL